MENDIFNFECVCVNEVFYSDKTFFGVYSVSTKEDIPKAKVRKGFSFNGENEEECIERFVTLAGKSQRLQLGCKYSVTATLIFNEKYNNWQYNPIDVKTIRPSSIEETLSFLKSILTDKQAQALVEAYPNIVDMIINNEYVDLSNVKGVANKTFERIKEKVLGSYGLQDLLVMLKPLGITLKQIQKISGLDSNTEIIKKRITDNPYILTQIKGLGFKKVDSIASKLNPNIMVSEFRAKAFIKYFFEDMGASTGDTLCNIDKLLKESENNIPECINLVKEIIEDNRECSRLLFVKDNLVGLKEYCNNERKVLNLLNQINKSGFDYSKSVDFPKAMEKAKEELGFELTEEQQNSIKNSLKYGVSIITASAGCVDCDTEFFNGKEWKPISKYVDGDYVLQYNKNGQADLVKPVRYIKQKADTLYHMYNKTHSVDQVLSLNHNVVYRGWKNELKEDKFSNIIENHNKNKLGFKGRFITTFNYNGKGINLNEFEIRLMCAVICDGYIPNENTKYCVINIKKQRKKERLEWILNNLNLEYKKRESTEEGYHVYTFYAPRADKVFNSWWYNCSKEQLEIISSEILHWDGSIDKIGRRAFDTTVKETADFIQFVFSSCGYRSTIYVHDRRGEYHKGNKYIRKSIEYSVIISKTQNQTVSICSRPDRVKNKIEEYKTKDGYEYCFEVPSHMLVLRRNNRIFITGNCGKTISIRGLLKALDGVAEVGLCSLSAKASRRMKEATGHEAFTIHKIVGYGQSKDDEFDRNYSITYYNERNPMSYDFIVVDEASMNNVDIFLMLLSAVKIGCHVVLVFDTEQLPPIGYGNIATDLLDSDFSVSRLTKVHRQALDSGILTDANKIRNQQMPIDSPKMKEVHGVNKDMCYMFRNNKEDLRDIAVSFFLKTIKEEGNLDDTIIIVPRKQKCTNSTLEINRKIQDALILPTVKKINRGDIEFRVGCRVIQRANNKDKGVINGELGYLKDIYTKEEEGKKQYCFSVLFDDGKLVEFDRDDVKDMELGYCLTVHSTQGSQWKNVIGIIDTSHYMLLSSNLLYTLITRASKKCLSLAEPSAFKVCVQKKASRRKTWLRALFSGKLD